MDRVMIEFRSPLLSSLVFVQTEIAAIREKDLLCQNMHASAESEQHVINH